MPINDFDFWWHLKTGDYILENKKLPDTDPFSYTTVSIDKDSPGRPQFILKQYWLGQVIFALIVKTFGLKGFIIMRALIFGLIGVIAFSASSRSAFPHQRSNPPTPPFRKGGRGGLLTPNSPASLRSAGRAELRTRDYTLYAIRCTLLFLLALITTECFTDRPQMFSFLFAILIVSIIEDSRVYGLRNILYCLPLIMLLWAQIHGGFVVGIAYLLVYLFTLPFQEGLKKYRRTFVTIILISLFITYLNPTRWQAFEEIFLAYRGSVVHKDTLEYLSPVKIIQFTMKSPGWISYWVVIGLSLVGAVNLFKSRSWSRLIILSGTALASLISMRYTYFFAPAAVAILPTALLSGKLQVTSGKLEKIPATRYTVYSILALILVFTVAFTYHKVNFKGLLKSETAYGFFPEQASEHIISRDIPQPMFNDATWGGYLAYRLWPNYKIFIDTRTLNIDIYRQYSNVLNWTGEGRSILMVYGIKSIITPAINPYSGEIFPLVRGLMKDDDWALVYLDGVAMIFVKKEYSTESFPKTAIYQEIFYEVTSKAPMFPGVPGYQRTMEELRMRQGF